MRNCRFAWQALHCCCPSVYPAIAVCLLGFLQHKRTCRRLLKHLPMIDNGEVEVDSLLVHNTQIIYKCSEVC